MRPKWKLLVENSIDGYHAASTRDTYFKYPAWLGTRTWASGSAASPGTWAMATWCWNTWRPRGRPVVKWERLSGPAAREGIEALRTRLAAEHGAERTRRMCDFNPQHAHLSEPDRQRHHGVTVRTFMPTSATAITVTAWEAAARDENPEVRQRRLDSR